MSIVQNNYMKRCIFVVLIFTILYPCFAQCPIGETITNAINFSSCQTWKMGLTSSYIARFDSTMKYKNRHPILFSQNYPRALLGAKEMYLSLQGTMYDIFPLPVINADSVDVSFSCKSQNVKKIFLAIDGINKDEEKIYSDTIFAKCCDEWQSYEKKILSREVSLIRLTIGFNGKDTVYFTKRNEPYKSIQNIWLDRIELKRNGQNIIDNSLYDCFPKSSLQAEDVMIWKDSLPLTLEEKAIVAFGESVHGSESINQSMIRMLQHEIKCNKRKLILLEMPLTKMLYINRFIQGDDTFKIEHIKSSIPTFLSDSWIDFFQWLKEYNSTAKEKVWMLGMDYDVVTILGPQMDLCEYVLTINRSLNNPYLKEFAQLLLTTDGEINNIQKSTEFFLEHDCFKKELGKQESQIVYLCLRTINDVTLQRERGTVISRDMIMFAHVKELIEKLSFNNIIKTLIYAHLGHVKYGPINVLQPINTPPLGTLCKQFYNNHFCTVSIFIGRGKILSVSRGGFEETLIKDPYVFSFEYWLDQCPLNCFYVPHSALPTNILFSRIIGTTSFEMIEWLNPSCRMEGVLYIKESTSLNKTLNITNKSIPFIQRYKKCIDEINSIH